MFSDIFVAWFSCVFVLVLFFRDVFSDCLATCLVRRSWDFKWSVQWYFLGRSMIFSLLFREGVLGICRLMFRGVYQESM